MHKINPEFQEERIYSRPDDYSLAEDLWKTSKVWFTLQRLARAYKDGISRSWWGILEPFVQNGRLDVPKPGLEVAFEGIIHEVKKFSEREIIEDNLVKPTTHLLDMVRSYAPPDYRSTRENTNTKRVVQIRRH